MASQDQYEGHQRIKDLEQQVGNLELRLLELAQASALENVITHGFNEISAQLAPLRDLRPQRQAPDAPEEAKLLRVQAELQRPTWGDPDFDKKDWATAVTRVTL